jgi:hypothetical protein
MPKLSHPKAQARLKDITAVFGIPGVAERRTLCLGGVSCVRFCVSRGQLREWLRKCAGALGTVLTRVSQTKIGANYANG